MTRRSTAWPLAALAFAAFAIGTSEFAPMALLPRIAEGLGVSIAQGGLLATVYATGVVVGAPTMTLLLARLRRRDALLILIALFTLGNALSALAPTYLALAGARIVTSLCHGAFFGIGALVATDMAGKGKATQAVATMFLGLTLANLVGAPASTTIGDLVGWRIAFGAMAALGLLALAALVVALDRGEPGRRPDIRHELAVLRGRSVLDGLAITTLSAGAMFSVYTYVVPMVRTITQGGSILVTAMLATIGLGFTVGNMLGGRLAARWPDASLVGFLALMAATMVAMPIVMQTAWGAALVLFLWGLAGFATVPAVQSRVMMAAEAAPGLASSINIGAFNLGNALGAALGSGVLSLGLGLRLVPVAGAMLALAAGAVVLVGRACPSRSPPEGDPSCACPPSPSP